LKYTGLHALLAAILLSAPAAASEPDIAGHAGSDAYEIVGEWANEATRDFPTDRASLASEAQPVFVAYRWLSVCAGSTFTDRPTIQIDCGAAQVCADSAERLYRLWGRLESGAWMALGAKCLGAPPTEVEKPRPRVTPALVLTEIRRIGLPTLQARTQPEGKTLVNFDTIFYTDAKPFDNRHAPGSSSRHRR
jgi:hypothetical protein